ncbi:hypothetical protein C8A01DRAFT_42483 [Parachaetomium inaequale]|uniref:Rhodopsin domain-containing protein n=1 Tax=Parachaetomium inaequale TaxID=2588326 RepID=A0AAN6SW74_9PEZI|nr:hypothetical protein C8A01DRAFT_42483 [Parachaetomium inaequale]
MGWTYNTKDPNAPTLGPLITGVASALTLLSLITVCLRVYVRAFLIKAFGAETEWGLGLRHIDDLPPEDIYNFGLLQYIGAPFYITSILGFKLALLFSYIRFVPIGAYRFTLFGVITACVLFHLSFLLVQFNLCQPARKQWDPTITYGSCIPGVPFYTSMASITIFFDVTVMLLPFPVLLQSRLQSRKKIIILGLFSLGIFITVTQIIRIQTIKKLANYIDSAPVILWSAVENNLGIIVANVPALAPLVKYYNERSSRSGTKGSTHRMGGGGGASAGCGTGGGTAGRLGGSTAYGSATSKQRGGVGGAGGRVSSWYTASVARSKGMETLASSVHDDGTELGSFDAERRSRSGGRGKGGSGSMDSILMDVCRVSGGSGGGSRDGNGEGEGGEVNRCVTPGGITKKVEVVITRSPGGS